MNLKINVGDTNYIALVNPDRYKGFVNEEWEQHQLYKHFLEETKNENILVFQMTKEGIQVDVNIDIEFNLPANANCFRHDSGFIRVTNKKLCFVEYNCLTMAAQFDDEVVPDKKCEKFCFDMVNGLYNVDVYQYFDIDKNKYIGSNKCDILFVFSKAIVRDSSVPSKVYWYSFSH